MSLSLPGKDKRPPADDSGLRTHAPASARRKAAEAPPGRDRREAFNGSRPQPVPSAFGTVEDPYEGKLGICCSGGGIRSAAFSLGALQTLGERKQLRQAAYLAAVSGGSYIAAAISMVAKEGPRDSDPELLDRLGPFAPGSPEEQYLRNHCSYLAPTGTDMLYLGLRIVLGLLINLIFISLPLIGLSLLLTGFIYAPLVDDLAGPCTGPTCAAVLPSWFWIAPLGLLGAGIACGLATLLFRWRKERWEQFFVAWTTRVAIASAVLAVILVGLPYFVDWLGHLAEPSASVKPSPIDTVGSLGAGFLALLVGVSAQVGRLVISKDGAEHVGRARKALGKAGSGVALGVAYAAGAVIGPLLLLLVVGITIATGMSEVEGGQVEWLLGAIGAGTLAMFAGIYYLVDLTTWSLHPFYKRRLSSAFALKRVSESSLDDEERRRVEALKPTKPEADVGIAIERSFDELVSLSETALEETAADRGWPTLLICAAANVSDPGATPPGRRVTSFTFSAGTAGGPLVGAVRMSRLERAFESKEEAAATEKSRLVGEEGISPKLDTLLKVDAPGARLHRRRDLTLPAAVAMSGAAVSPSMGKMTPRALTFLMALANLRLGVWVPNPRWVTEVHEDTPLPRKFAKPRPSYLIRELFGRNRVDARYLYVTDGGHYENLGLVELLRRGCTKIYCFDASGVGAGRAEFEALGDAIALARSELGVEIDFGEEDPADLAQDEKTHLAKKDVVTGRIRYRGGPEGTLIYVRNTMTGKATWDARAHQMKDPRFPNNSTLDQLYTDQKFEAYRVLGARAAGRAVKAMEAA